VVALGPGRVIACASITADASLRLHGVDVFCKSACLSIRKSASTGSTFGGIRNDMEPSTATLVPLGRHDLAVQQQPLDGSHHEGAPELVASGDRRDHHDNYFAWLPDELVLAILAAIDDAQTFVSWAQTSRRHHDLSGDAHNDLSVWRRLCESRFGPLLHTRFAAFGKSWRWLYQAQARPAAPIGPDIGAAIITTENREHVYWGECLDGLPNGYGLALLLPTRHCTDPGVPTRAWTDPSDTTSPIDTGYEGEWRGGLMCGRGVLTAEDGSTYDGQWVDDQREGHGTSTWPDGDCYMGQWRDDQRDGQGKYTYASGTTYEGEWKVHPHGRGTFVYRDGGSYRGYVSDGTRHGRGLYVHADGECYNGEYNAGCRHDFGTCVYANGNRYEGQWHDGLYHGYGVYTEIDGSRYDGEWDLGYKHGGGAQSFVDGSCVRGEWRYDTIESGEIVRHRYGADPSDCESGSACVACVAFREAGL
jgi:hypothetical protein